MRGQEPEGADAIGSDSHAATLPSKERHFGSAVCSTGSGRERLRRGPSGSLSPLFDIGPVPDHCGFENRYRFREAGRTTTPIMDNLWSRHAKAFSDLCRPHKVGRIYESFHERRLPKSC